MDVNRSCWASHGEQDRFPVTDPSTGECIALVQGCGPAEVDQAVRAVHRAFQQCWRWRPGREQTIETLEEFGWTKLICMPSGLAAVPVWSTVAEVGL